MNSAEIPGFLKAIDSELVQHVREGEILDLYLIGKSALIVRFGLNLARKDVDIVHFHASELEDQAVELFGKRTLNAERLGFYLEPVPQGLPPIPGGYCRRSQGIPGNWQVLRPEQPQPDHVAVTKLSRFHAKDREDLQILGDSGSLNGENLSNALASAFMWDEEDDPKRKRAYANLQIQIDYLDGKRRQL